MKLSQLIPHTSTWLGIPRSTVESVAKYLRPAGLISSGGRGPGGAEMSEDDKINLLLGVCGVEVAVRAPEYVREWRRSIRADDTRHSQSFAFLTARNVRDLIVDLVTKDLKDDAALANWLKESRADLEAAAGRSLGPNHSITLDFFVDEFSLELWVSRNFYHDRLSLDFRLPKVASDTICVRFVRPPPPYNDFPLPERLKPDDYHAPSKLIRRLSETNLIGWGQCLAK